MTQKAIKGKLFRRFSAVTVIAVYLLILVGGIVRSTGSGMGCPDWPKCFGSWVPPTEVSQLPENYKEIYAQQRAEKNERFVSYLTAFGFEDLAYQIKNDPDILNEADFNPTKTWTEYVNRLVGAVIGFLIFGTFICSLTYWKADRTIAVLSFIAFVLVGFQGWIGSIVVSTNLLQWMITVHMLLALVIVCLLIYVHYRSKRSNVKLALEKGRMVSAVLMSAILLSLVQIVLGTQVREALDIISESLNRTQWISALGVEFKIHRSYSILLLGVHLYLTWMVSKDAKADKKAKLLVSSLLLLVGCEAVSGIVMAYFGVPPAVQPIHLLLGSLIIGVQYYILLLLSNKRIERSIIA